MSNADVIRRLSMVESELTRLRQQVPVRIGGEGLPISPIIIIGGQTAFSDSGGVTAYMIAKLFSVLDGITTQTYDPGTVNASTGAQTGAPSPGITAWPSGLGFGTRWTGMEYERVIVVNDSRCPIPSVLVGGASDDTTYAPSTRQRTILSSRQGTVRLADNSTISVWIPDL